MKTILIGDTIFTKRCLDTLLENEFNVVGVAQTDPCVADDVSDYYNLKTISEDFGIPYQTYVGINDPELLRFATKLEPDIILAFGSSSYIREALLRIPKLGCIASHMGLLPEYPGPNSISWTILKSLSTTGVTFYRVSPMMYSGNIIMREECEVLPEETATTLYNKLCRLAEIMIPKLKLELCLGLPKQRVQKFEDMVSFMGWITNKDRQLKFDNSCEDLLKKIRAFTAPMQGAWFVHSGFKIFAWQGNVGKHKTKKPLGSIVYEDEEHFVVTTQTNDLVLSAFEKWPEKK